MNRAIVLILQAGLLLTAVAGILFALRIILQQTVGGPWFWGGAMAAFAGPTLFALALYLFERRNGAGNPNA